MPGITWILVADVSRARLFEHRQRSERTLVPIFDDDQREFRDREQRRASDRPGRMHESYTTMRHAAEPHTSNDERAREQYARMLIARIHTEARKRTFHNLVLVGPPAMLGTLRSLLDAELSSRVVGELAKDLTWISERNLPDHLREWVTPKPPAQVGMTSSSTKPL
jgi:protein required for attachment to host cells